MVAIRPVLAHITGISVFINILVLTIPIYMMQIFDRVVSTGHVETLLFLSLMAVVALVVHAALDVLRGLALNRAGAMVVDSLKPDLARAALYGPGRGLDLGSRATEDVDMLRAVITSPAFTALFDLPWLPVFIVAIWFVHPVLGATAIVGATVLVLVALAADRLARAFTQGQNQLDAGRSRLLSHAVTASPSVLASALELHLLSLWWGEDTKQSKQRYRGDDIASASSSIIRGVRMLIQIAALGSGVYLVIQNEMSPASVMAISILLGRALAPVDALVGGWRQLSRAREAVDHMTLLIDHVPDTQDDVVLSPIKGELRLEGVSCALPGSRRMLLHQVGLIFPAGACIAVTGGTGAGKSTLCEIIARVRPVTSGRVRLDGTDLSDWPAEALAGSIGYARSKSDLLPVSISANISRLVTLSDSANQKEVAELEKKDAEAPSSTNSRIAEAARLAGVHDLILALPDGYATLIGSDGAPLSSGLQQGIALARAVYGRPKLLILDDLNLGYSSSGQVAILRVLIAARAWGTMVIFTMVNERLIQAANLVASLDQGKLSFIGTLADFETRRRDRAAQVQEQKI